MENVATSVKLELSDLFFNHAHEHYNSLDFQFCDSSDIEAAIAVDAAAFVEAYPQVCEFFGLRNASDLARDFMDRL